jgi:hypothetical protein
VLPLGSPPVVIPARQLCRLDLEHERQRLEVPLQDNPPEEVVRDREVLVAGARGVGTPALVQELLEALCPRPRLELREITIAELTSQLA